MTIDRRTLLGAAGAIGALAAGGAMSATDTRITPSRFAPSKAKVIDVHTHMFSESWMAAVHAARDPNFQLGQGVDLKTGQPMDGALIYRGSSIGRIVPAMLNYDIRIKAMDEAKVDVALISLTAPNVYWGTQAQSAAAARAINDDFAAAQKKYDGRIRWMASLPWQYAGDAIVELKRARANGAIGVCMLTNILGTPLTDPQYAPIWKEIEAMELPVFIHPTSPMNDGMGLNAYGFFNSIGFTAETTLCFERMIFSGFLDKYPKLNLIACHGGGTIPYLIGRFDAMWTRMDALKTDIKEAPSTYLNRLYFDSIVYRESALKFMVGEIGADRILYGSDYPFNLGDMAGVLSRVDTLPPEQRDAIRSGNALKIFDL